MFCILKDDDNTVIKDFCKHPLTYQTHIYGDERITDKDGFPDYCPLDSSKPEDSSISYWTQKETK